LESIFQGFLIEWLKIKSGISNEMSLVESSNPERALIVLFLAGITQDIRHLGEYLTITFLASDGNKWIQPNFGAPIRTLLVMGKATQQRAQG
jgi:hypothetical protein